MKILVLDLLGVYKAIVSPFLPPACRFEPTCSEYAREAVEKYGALRGAWMGAEADPYAVSPFAQAGTIRWSNLRFSIADLRLNVLLLQIADLKSKIADF